MNHRQVTQEEMDKEINKGRRYDLARVFAEALLKAREIQRLRDGSRTEANPEGIAKDAITMADALIEELAK